MVNPIDWLEWIYGKWFVNHQWRGFFSVVTVCCIVLSVIIGALWLRAVDKYTEKQPTAPKQQTVTAVNNSASQSVTVEDSGTIPVDDSNILADVIAGWDSNNRQCRNEVHTAALVKYAKDYWVYVACGFESPTRDRLFDPRIVISSRFSIDGSAHIMNIIYPTNSPLRRGTNTDRVFHAVFLLPKETDVSVIKTLHDLKANNGKLVVELKVSGMGTIPAP